MFVTHISNVVDFLLFYCSIILLFAFVRVCVFVYVIVALYLFAFVCFSVCRSVSVRLLLDFNLFCLLV